MSFVRSGSEVPPGTTWVGAPARQVRAVSEAERAWKIRGTAVYHDLARRCLIGIMPCEPLAEEEPDRPRPPGDYVPLREWRGESEGGVEI